LGRVGAPLRIVGIDPGTQFTGFGVVEPRGSSLVLIEAGCFAPKAALPLQERLAEIHRGLTELFERTEPTHAAVETVFFAKNVKSAITLGHARGVALAAIGEAGLELFEYAPTEVKRAVVGTGRAEKEQVAHMVRLLLGQKVPGRLDVTDACAVAICHANTWRSNPLLR
jgi:crossover junction endodeoxyribonuclease RuvC